jgi:hypothetical protein
MYIIFSISVPIIADLPINFPDWCGVRNKNARKSKIGLFLLKVICISSITFLASFKNIFENIKGLKRNSVQFCFYAFLNVFNILKPVYFEGIFTVGETKNPLM